MEKFSDLKLSKTQNDCEEQLYEIKQSLLEKGITIVGENEVVKFEGKIGEGSSGCLYKGMYGSIEVAIKKLRIKPINKANIDNAISEIQILAKVKHDKIPRLYGIWERKNKLYFLIEYVEGETLEKAFPKLNFKQKLRLMSDFCLVLGYLHENGIVHRDIKPTNVMISKGGSLKLIDFGVSKVCNRTKSFDKSLAGSYAYMGPENFNLDEDSNEEKPIALSPKFDVWSTGCMISRIFTGVTPWCKKTCDKLSEYYIQAILAKRKKFPIPENCPLSIVPIIQMSVQNDPEERCYLIQLKDAIDNLIDISPDEEDIAFV